MVNQTIDINTETRGQLDEKISPFASPEAERHGFSYSPFDMSPSQIERMGKTSKI